MHQPQWYAVRTRSNYEKRVSAMLAEKGVEQYLPAYREMRQWKDRKKLIELPLFPGYLFTRMVDSREGRLSVLCNDGVVAILGSGDSIEPIPDREIEAVQKVLDARTRCQAHPLLREGAWVRVKRGALKNMEGLLVRMKGHNRLAVSITLLSQSVSVEMDAADVQFLRSTSEEVRRIA
jgi:transcription antitermination factor NusG